MANKLVTQIIQKKNPCIVGIDPDWEKIPECYKREKNICAGIQMWCYDVIDAVADMITVNPYLGMDSVEPFVEAAVKYQKGIFILARTSNAGATDFQNAIIDEMSVSEKVVYYVAESARKSVDESGYSMIGAVVGATFPREAVRMREIMKNSFFLVPGYGAQGGTAEECMPYFNEDGLGALVSSSRQILYTYENTGMFRNTRESYRECVRSNSVFMRQQVYEMLKETYPKLVY